MTETTGSDSYLEYEPKEYIKRIHSNYAKMSAAERKIADYLLQSEPDEDMPFTAGGLAKATNTSSPTVVRFCRDLGFDGFAEFKYSLKNAANTPLGGDVTISGEDSIDALKCKVASAVLHNVQELTGVLDSGELARAVDAISHCKQVMFCGNGSTSGIAQAASNAFSSIGIPSLSPVDPISQIRSACLMDRGDVVVGITTCGYVKNVADVLSVAHNQGITTICITAAHDTPSTYNADIVLYNPSDNVALPFDVSVTVISQLVTLQILQVAVVVQNYTKLLEKSQDLRKYSQLNHYSQNIKYITLERMSQN